MSRSLKRVQAFLERSQTQFVLKRTERQARTAEEASTQIGCQINQIVKSMVFVSIGSPDTLLLLTAGGNQVSETKAERLSGTLLKRASAGEVRARTGFVIGGVAPICHTGELACYMDPKLFEFGQVWAAAGTPFHVFSIDPRSLAELSGAKVEDFTQ